jgi:alkylated DNA nucleotide flippase Atl1
MDRTPNNVRISQIALEGETVALLLNVMGYSDVAKIELHPSEARQIGESLIGIARTAQGEIDRSLAAQIAALRRDQQQMLTALQEVARKVAKHEQLVMTTSITINPTGDLENALSMARQIGDELHRMPEAAFAC